MYKSVLLSYRQSMICHVECGTVGGVTTKYERR